MTNHERIQRAVDRRLDSSRLFSRFLHAKAEIPPIPARHRRGSRSRSYFCWQRQRSRRFVSTYSTAGRTGRSSACLNHADGGTFLRIR